MEEFYINDDGIRLHAKLERPERFGEGPLAIVIHGLTGNMEERHNVAAAKALREAGCATLRVDLYGHGGSDGEFAEHTLYKWITNVLAVIDFAKRTYGWATKLFLVGQSQGGLTTMLVAGMRADDLAAIGLLSPAIVIVDGAREGNLLGSTFDPVHIPDVVGVGWSMLNGNYLRVAQTLDVEGAIARYHGPVLLVHGTADEAVPVRYAEEYGPKYANCELVLIDGDTHTYKNHLDQVTAAITDFFRRQV